jgi:hypothetical protein
MEKWRRQCWWRMSRTLAGGSQASSASPVVPVGPGLRQRNHFPLPLGRHQFHRPGQRTSTTRPPPRKPSGLSSLKGSMKARIAADVQRLTAARKPIGPGDEALGKAIVPRPVVEPGAVFCVYLRLIGVRSSTCIVRRTSLRGDHLPRPDVDCTPDPAAGRALST